MTNDSRHHHRRSLCALTISATFLLAACGTDGGSIEAVGERSTPSTTTGGDATETTADSGEPSEQEPATTTTAPTPTTPAEILASAVAAYRDELAAAGPIRVLEMTVWFPESGDPYAAMQSQDPAKPANVDERRWNGSSIEDPEPVQLMGDGSLEENLFGLDDINWTAIADALAGAPTLVEQQLATTFEDSKGVTHIIATKDLPFSPNTVVRVYVDGGARTTGGYVQYLADGSLDKVQA